MLAHELSNFYSVGCILPVFYFKFINLQYLCYFLCNPSAGFVFFLQEKYYCNQCSLLGKKKAKQG